MPQVTARELVRFLKSQGYVEQRQTGSHPTLLHVRRGVSLTVPVHTGVDIGRGLTDYSICGCGHVISRDQ